MAPPMSVADTLELLTDQELDQMKRRAWVRAARAWQDCRTSHLSNVVRLMISNEAYSEEQFVNACIREQSRRREIST